MRGERNTLQQEKLKEAADLRGTGEGTESVSRFLQVDRAR